MTRYLLFAISYLLISSCVKPLPEKKHLGAWSLHIIEYYDEDKEQWLESDWMKNGKGILNYDENSRMSVHFTPENYAPFQINEADSMTFGYDMFERSALGEDYWYVGKYRFSNDKRYVYHYRVMHSDPEDEGIEVKRKIDYDGDTLILTSTEREVNLRLKWVPSR